LPLRDLMSMVVAMVSYGGDKVEWRGQVLRTRRAAAAEPALEADVAAPAAYAPPPYQPDYGAPTYAAAAYAPREPSAAS
jgi:hypothetical protein